MSFPDIITISEDSKRGDSFLRLCIDRSPLFICTIATTETAAIPGISAAGASPELICRDG